MKLHRFAACCLFWAGFTTASTTDGLLAYYDFEETDDLGGLNNKAPGATGYNATRYGGGTFDNSTSPSGPGFAGQSNFDSGYGASDRSQLRVGKALNLAAPRGDAIVVPVGSSALGTSFTIAAWHALTPGFSNPSNRYHVFEASSTDNWDVSWGTSNTTFTTPQPSYTYLAYVGSGPAGGFGPAGVTTYQWHHVAHVFTAAGGLTRLDVYLDGSWMASRTASTSSMSFTSLHFGRARSGTSGRDWDGLLDEVGLWTRALSSLEVAELYHRGLSGYAITTDLSSLGRAFVGAVSGDTTQGTTTGSGIYPLGETATIEAQPYPGFLFSTWGAPFAGQPATHSFAVTATTGTTATFGPDLADPDLDGLSNHDEIVIHHTNPELADTDGDQLGDGAEVEQTLTDPLTSNLPAVQWVIDNLPSPGHLSGPVLSRETGSNTVSFQLGLRESGALTAPWSPWLFNTPGATVGVSGGLLQVVVPGSAEDHRFFRLEGESLAP